MFDDWIILIIIFSRHELSEEWKVDRVSKTSSALCAAAGASLPWPTPWGLPWRARVLAAEEQRLPWERGPGEIRLLPGRSGSTTQRTQDTFRDDVMGITVQCSLTQNNAFL